MAVAPVGNDRIITSEGHVISSKRARNDNATPSRQEKAAWYHPAHQQDRRRTKYVPEDPENAGQVLRAKLSEQRVEIAERLPRNLKSLRRELRDLSDTTLRKVERAIVDEERKKLDKEVHHMRLFSFSRAMALTLEKIKIGRSRLRRRFSRGYRRKLRFSRTGSMRERITLPNFKSSLIK
jgi:hypothetical protein